MTERPAYLLLLARASERNFSDYLAALPALQQDHGGQFRAMAPAPMVEQFGHNGAAFSLMLSCWPSIQRLRSFWRTAAHRVLLRRFSADAMVAAALEAAVDPRQASGAKALGIFLGPGPTPALLEAAGAQALALVREPQVEPLKGDWTHGDVAIYGWDSARSARQHLGAFSSGQRGRAMLLSGLHRQQQTTTRNSGALPRLLLQAS